MRSQLTLKEKYSFIEGLFEKEKGYSLVEIGLTEKFRLKIEEFAHHLLKSNFPYDTLCWALAELQLIFERGYKKYSESELIEREKKIFDTSRDNEEICWFVASLKVYLEEISLYPQFNL